MSNFLSYRCSHRLVKQVCPSCQGEYLTCPECHPDESLCDLCKPIHPVSSREKIKFQDKPHSSLPSNNLISCWDMLTPREQQMAAYCRQGFTNPEISAALNLSPKTVKGYVEHTLQKLQVMNKTELCLLFYHWDFSEVVSSVWSNDYLEDIPQSYKPNFRKAKGRR